MYGPHRSHTAPSAGPSQMPGSQSQPQHWVRSFMAPPQTTKAQTTHPQAGGNALAGQVAFRRVEVGTVFPHRRGLGKVPRA